ncbi:hypothetical protein [Kitasatospora purpeofusca]|uniref:hypothetical protein n=1 Tax=Kitasatospora purpeofusca TaxID=67352 RepID=UPI0038674EE0|nr:hypothetical protein OIP63_37710 [Kitasatospora purpeofusca]
MTTTYLDVDGAAVGIAIAAPAYLEALAQQSLQQWTAVLRTRRVLVLLSDARSGGNSADGRGLAVCPKAAASRGLVRQYQRRRDTVLLLGTGRASCANDDEPSGPAIAVPDLATAHRVQIPDPERLSFVLAPCSIVNDVTPLLRELRSRFPLLRGQHPDQWCYVASDAQLAARAAAEASDLVLDLNPTGRAEAAIPPGVAVRRVEALSDIRAADLADAATIAILSSPHALYESVAATERPVVTAAGIIEVLSGLGPLSVVQHLARTAARTDIYARIAPTDGPASNKAPA